MPQCTLRSQRTTCKDQLSPSTLRVPGSSSGSQAWRQASVPAQPSHLPYCLKDRIRNCVSLKMLQATECGPRHNSIKVPKVRVPTQTK